MQSHAKRLTVGCQHKQRREGNSPCARFRGRLRNLQCAFWNRDAHQFQLDAPVRDVRILNWPLKLKLLADERSQRLGAQFCDPQFRQALRLPVVDNRLVHQATIIFWRNRQQGASESRVLQ